MSEKLAMEGDANDDREREKPIKSDVSGMKLMLFFFSSNKFYNIIHIILIILQQIDKATKLQRIK